MKTKTKTALTITVVVISIAAYFAIKPLNWSDPTSKPEYRDTNTAEIEKSGVDRLASDVAVSREGRSESPPYGGLSFVEAKAGAESGDPVAQRILSQMYQECFIYNLNPQKNVISQIAQISKENPQYVSKLKTIRERYETFCPTVDGGQSIPHEASTLWLEQAARGGDLVARIGIASNPLKKPAQEEISAIIKALREARDLDAVFKMGDLAEDAQSIMSDTELAQAFEGPNVGYAWQVAACRSGYDCSDRAVIMRNLCFTGSCSYSNYETLVLEQAIPSGQRRYFENQVAFIQAHFLR
jgi:hypothetical protein